MIFVFLKKKKYNDSYLHFEPKSSIVKFVDRNV